MVAFEFAVVVAASAEEVAKLVKRQQPVLERVDEELRMVVVVELRRRLEQQTGLAVVVEVIEEVRPDEWP